MRDVQEFLYKALRELINDLNSGEDLGHAMDMAQCALAVADEKPVRANDIKYFGLEGFAKCL